MNRFIIYSLAVMAFFACGKAQTEGVSPASPQPSQVMSFDFEPGLGEETRAKAGWEPDDRVFIFFKDIPGKYLTMDYDGSSWSLESSQDFVPDDFASLAAQELTAIHFPQFAGSVSVASGDDGFTFTDAEGEEIFSYYMSSQASYVVEGTLVSASFTMSKPSGYVQFFVPMSGDELENGYGYRLLEAHLAPSALTGLGTGGEMTFDAKPSGYAVPGYAASNSGEEGFIFSGALSSAGEEAEYFWSLVTLRSEAMPYALGTRTLSGTRSISEGVIFSFPEISTSWSDFGRWVDIGLPSGTKWATGYLNVSTGIDEPEAQGDYFSWGDVNPLGTPSEWNPNGYLYGNIEHYKFYVGSSGSTSLFSKYVSVPKYWGGEGAPDNLTVLDEEDDAAYYHTSGEWRMPDTAQLAELVPLTSSTAITTYGDISGDEIVGLNGLHIFFRMSGFFKRDGNPSQSWSLSVRNLNSHIYIFSRQLDTSNNSLAYVWWRQIKSTSNNNTISCLGRFPALTVRPVLNEVINEE